MRVTRRAVNVLLPLAGMIVAFAGVLFLDGQIPTLLAVLLGILLVEAGTRNLANPFLPESRRYHELRDEMDEFIEMVRRLNMAAIRARMRGSSDDWDQYEQILTEMHGSVDRMGTLAGKETDTPTTNAPPR